MTMRIAALLGVFLLAPVAAGQDKKADDALAKSLQEADVVFTGQIGKVNLLGRTNSIPPNTFGKITFKDARALHGAVEEAPMFSYSYKKGTTMNVDLEAKGQVLVAVKGKAVTVIVPATEANLALAKKVIEARGK
jgi:hypothetical protein